MPEPLLFAALLVGTLALAWYRGGREERLAALALVAGAILTPLAQHRGFAGPEHGIVLVDLLLFAALGAIALRSRAFWPLWAAGFQLGALAVHLAAAQMPAILPAAYAATLIIWSYPVVVAVALGTWFEGGNGHGSGNAGTGQPR
jgi:hypothetical protein